MTDDLTSWLRQQLDDDARVARSAANATSASPHWEHDSWVREIRDVPNAGTVANVWRESIGEHIARHDPDRALRGIEIKRLLLRDLADAKVSLRHAGSSGTPYDLLTGAVNALQRAIRLLAAEYADRPGYREEWRP